MKPRLFINTLPSVKVFRKLWLGVLVLFPFILSAQVLSVNTKSTVELGEQFRVEFQLNADGSDFRGPDFRNFTVLSGPMLSTSSSIQIVNGKMDRTHSQTYTYILRANKEGDYTIGSASVIVDNSKVTSQSVQIKVVPASTQSAPAQSGGSTSSGQQSDGISAKDLFVRAIVDKSSAYVGEQILITYKLYTRVSLRSVNVTKLSSFPGFWTKNLLEPDKQLQQSKQIIDGQEYIVADIRKLALYPQKAGKITLDPIELSCEAQIRVQSSQRGRDPFGGFFDDPFFNRNIRNVQKNLSSNRLSVDVLPLPSTKKPPHFNGAVGQFDMKVAPDRTHLAANDAINYSVTISGKGNLELLELPKPVFSPDFEVFDPKIVSNIKTDASGIHGSKQAEYLLIPRYAGSYSIPPIEFAYFDPVKKEYVNLKSEAFEIVVDKGSAKEGGMVHAGPSQEGVRYIGSDIMHIKTSPARFRQTGTYFFASFPYFIINALLILLFVAGLLLIGRRKSLQQNQSLMKNKKATKIAKKRLQVAEKHMKKAEQNEFYSEISQALWGYLSDKFNIARAELSIDNVQSTLKGIQVEDEIVDQFVEVLNKCEYARFAPGEAGKKMEDLYKQALEIITKAERTIK